MNPRLLRPLASGFDPRRIAGLQLWLDADDSSTITVETGVKEWADKSGRGIVFSETTTNNQPATGTQTINGRNVLVFDGSNDGLVNSSQAFPAASPMTIFLVQRLISTTNFGMTYSSGTGVTSDIRQNSTTGRMRFVGSGNTEAWTEPNSATSANRMYSMVMRTTGTNNSFYTNGSEDALGAAPQSQATFAAQQWIGRRADGFYANIWLAELLCYNSALNDAARVSVETYLSKKWGI
jgi:hypothetical protein